MRRRKTPQDDRIILLHEAAFHIAVVARRRRLGSPETEGDRALLAAIEDELSPSELELVRRHADAGRALRPLTREEEERSRESAFFVNKAGVCSGAGGWEKVRESANPVASLDEHRKAKETGESL